MRPKATANTFLRYDFHDEVQRIMRRLTRSRCTWVQERIRKLMQLFFFFSYLSQSTIHLRRLLRARVQNYMDFATTFVSSWFPMVESVLNHFLEPWPFILGWSCKSWKICRLRSLGCSKRIPVIFGSFVKMKDLWDVSESRRSISWSLETRAF